mgnify:CR=1 FL=1
METAINIHELTVSYGVNLALWNVSTQIPARQISGIIGPNGAGKTSSFYIIAGLTTSNGGQIQLAGEDVTNMPMHKRSKLGIKSKGLP